MGQLYICSTCKATKFIRQPPHMSNEDFKQKLPERVICGVRGCMTYATKKEN